MSTDPSLPSRTCDSEANDLTLPQGAAATADLIPAAVLTGSLPPVGHCRRIICGLLFFATTINYIDRQILSLLKPILDEQFHWTDSQFGLVNSIFALCVLPVMVATKLSVWRAVLLIALAGAAHQAWSANLFTTVSDMFPKAAVASVTGMGGLAGAIGGMIFPLYSGHLLDSFKAHGDESGAYGSLRLICAFAYVATSIAHHLLAPRFERFAMSEK